MQIIIAPISHTHLQASSFALAVVFFFLPVMKIEVLTNSASDTYL